MREILFIYTLDPEQLSRLRVATQWLKHTKENNFNMGNWVNFPLVLDDMRKEVRDFFDKDYRDILIDKNRLAACGSVSCFSGTINLNFASNENYKKEFESVIPYYENTSLKRSGHSVMVDSSISSAFLKLPVPVAKILFLSHLFYVKDGHKPLQDITKKEVINKLAEILELGFIKYEYFEQDNYIPDALIKLVKVDSNLTMEAL
jgi:hypothetical protein